MRLDKYLAAHLKLGSRKDVKKMIKDGRIAVNGKPAAVPETPVTPGTDMVCLDGAELKYREHVYIMLNKPKGYVSAVSDNFHKAVTELVPEEFKKFSLFPMGRLDIDTTGLLILTDDGALAHKLLSPGRHIPKTYEAELSESVTAEDIRLFRDGLLLEDGFKCRPAELVPRGERRALIVICEGKFHQVKRMFEAVGKIVTALRRIKMNGLELDESLAAGEARELTEEELDLLINGSMEDRT